MVKDDSSGTSNVCLDTKATLRGITIPMPIPTQGSQLSTTADVGKMKKSVSSSSKGAFRSNSLGSIAPEESTKNISRRDSKKRKRVLRDVDSADVIFDKQKGKGKSKNNKKKQKKERKGNGSTDSGALLQNGLSASRG
jgi:hypothetical protein